MNAKPVHFLFQQSMSENNNTQPKVADNREDGLLKNLDNFSSTDPHTASFDNLFISIAGLIGYVNHHTKSIVFFNDFYWMKLYLPPLGRLQVNWTVEEWILSIGEMKEERKKKKAGKKSDWFF